MFCILHGRSSPGPLGLLRSMGAASGVASYALLCGQPLQTVRKGVFTKAWNALFYLFSIQGPQATGHLISKTFADFFHLGERISPKSQFAHLRYGDKLISNSNVVVRTQHRVSA